MAHSVAAVAAEVASLSPWLSSRWLSSGHPWRLVGAHPAGSFLPFPGLPGKPPHGCFSSLAPAPVSCGLGEGADEMGGQEGTGAVLDGRWRKDAGRRGIPGSHEEGNGTAHSQLLVVCYQTRARTRRKQMVEKGRLQTVHMGWGYLERASITFSGM